MKLFLSAGWEADLMEEALKRMLDEGGQTAEHATILLERIERCKELQKPHNKHNPT